MTTALTIPYTPIWFDYPLADGTYTPRQLRQAGLTVQHGPERTYTLAPGGEPQPPRLETTAQRLHRGQQDRALFAAKKGQR